MTALSMRVVATTDPMPVKITRMTTEANVIKEIKSVTSDAKELYKTISGIYNTNGTHWPGHELLKDIEDTKKTVLPEIASINSEFRKKVRKASNKEEKKKLRKEKNRDENELTTTSNHVIAVTDKIDELYTKYAQGKTEILKIFSKKIPKPLGGSNNEYKSVDILHWCYRCKLLIMQAVYHWLIESQDSGELSTPQSNVLHLDQEAEKLRVTLFFLRKRLHEIRAHHAKK